MTTTIRNIEILNKSSRNGTLMTYDSLSTVEVPETGKRLGQVTEDTISYFKNSYGWDLPKNASGYPLLCEDDIKAGDKPIKVTKIINSFDFDREEYVGESYKFFKYKGIKKGFVAVELFYFNMILEITEESIEAMCNFEKEYSEARGSDKENYEETLASIFEA